MVVKFWIKTAEINGTMSSLYFWPRSERVGYDKHDKKGAYKGHKKNKNLNAESGYCLKNSFKIGK